MGVDEELLKRGQQQARVANDMRRAVIDDFKAGRITFEDVLNYAATQKPIARMQMTRVLKAHGWKKRQFMIAVNVLKLPVNNRLDWWTSERNAEELDKLRLYMTSGAVRASTPERFPWSDAPIP
jgi:hypothetical protein